MSPVEYLRAVIKRRIFFARGQFWGKRLPTRPAERVQTKFAAADVRCSFKWNIRPWRPPWAEYTPANTVVKAKAKAAAAAESPLLKRNVGRRRRPPALDSPRRQLKEEGKAAMKFELQTASLSSSDHRDKESGDGIRQQLGQGANRKKWRRGGKKKKKSAAAVNHFASSEIRGDKFACGS
jgi:hypothetical protein